MPEALRLSRETQSRILTLLSQEDYNVTMFHSQLQSLQARSSALTNEAAAADQEVVGLRANASGLLERARSLLNESKDLDRVATDLLARAHAALEYANDSVRSGSEIISAGRSLLETLRSRLGGASNLSLGLDQLLQELATAESLSGSALVAATTEASVLAEAMTLLQSATSLLEAVNNKLSTITQVSMLSCLLQPASCLSPPAAGQCSQCHCSPHTGWSHCPQRQCHEPCC